MVKQKADEPLEEFAERCQSLANDTWAEDNQDMAAQSAMDAFLHGVLDTESAYSAMDKNPLDLVKRALHIQKALFGHRLKPFIMLATWKKMKEWKKGISCC